MFQLGLDFQYFFAFDNCQVIHPRGCLLARPAAVKLIRASNLGDASSEELVRRFEREAQVTAGLSSPHTVQLYEVLASDPNQVRVR